MEPRTMNKAVFLDRDGTIAKDVHYCRRLEDFEILPTVPEAVRLLNENGFQVVVITNQSGIARGYFTEETLAQIHRKMEDELQKHGAWVDAIYCCPHHPDDGCECRKPKTALFLKAAKELDIHINSSYVVGDMPMDIDAGKVLGCKTILVTTGPQPPTSNPKPLVDPPDYIANSLLEAAKWIINPEPRTLNVEHRTTIIVPAYNEEEGLPIVLEKIFKIADGSYEIIVVDDGSTDRTSEVATQFPCSLIRHETNQGKGEALKAGIKHAKGENIIWIDADDSYPAEVIPQMAEALKTYDIVVGSRVCGRENIPRFNRVGNWIFRNMIKRIYSFKPYDPLAGLYGARKCHLENMNLSSHHFAIEPEISIKGSRMKLKMLDIPIEYRSRVGDAKLNGIKVGFEDLRIILSLILWHQQDGGK
jgi:histidinol-phosphate phosphatase family protein